MSEPTPEYDPATDLGKVRLLLNDVAAPWVFTDTELQALLDLEGSVKAAAAQAIDTNATNLVLASRVLRTQDLSTDGAKVADAMRKHADRLRAQAAAADEDGDGFYFEVVDLDTTTRPEHTVWPQP
ncbi:hypothetical protein [Nocardioides pakistanensis]